MADKIVKIVSIVSLILGVLILAFFARGEVNGSADDIMPEDSMNDESESNISIEESNQLDISSGIKAEIEEVEEDPKLNEINSSNIIELNESNKYEENLAVEDYLAEQNISVETFELQSNEVNYEKIVHVQEENNQSDIQIDTIDVPSGNISTLNVSFNFDFNYYDLNLLECTFWLRNNSDYLFINITGNYSEFVELSHIVQNGEYKWGINCFDFQNLSVNTSIEGEFKVFVNQTPIIDFKVNKDISNISENLIFTLNLTTYKNESIYYKIDFKDGSFSSNFYPNINSLFLQQSHNFSSLGFFYVELNLSIGSEQFYRKLYINVSSKSILQDNEEPEIILREPENNVELNGDNIEFKFSVKDNIKVANCTFNLYYYNNSRNIGSSIYREFRNNPLNGENISIKLKDFDEGDYTWEVECYDNSSNYERRDRDFSYQTDSVSNNKEENSLSIKLNGVDVNVSQKDINELEDLVEKINDFLINEEKYSKEQKDAIESMNLIEEIRLYKKKLLQFKSDIERNSFYIQDSDTREKRLNEIENEIEIIRQKIPENLEVKNIESFSKNSIDSNLNEILDEYNKANNIFMNKNEMEDFLDSTIKLQNDLSVETSVKFIEITYLDVKKEITLIERKVNIKDSSSVNEIIEVVPKKVAENYASMTILNKNKMIKEDPIISLDSDDLINSKLIYYIEKFVDINELKKADTLAFSTEIDKISLKKTGITGYSILFFGSGKSLWFYMSWILFVFVLFVVVFSLYNSRKVSKIKRKSEFRQMAENMKNASKALKDNDLAKAKMCYSNLKKIYSLSDNSLKEFVFEKIVRLQLEIDKKEIVSLIKECMQAIKEKRVDDARLIYSKIKPIYGRLPEELKKKVYDKIVPYVSK